ncbi:YdbL family protein [Scandinavium sp. V105_16]|uniref:YdbL family protein n=1 Tax=Scandinavium lactucae TaxID=3095028 RepID=A0AAJ2SCA6_9ENTR|nr:MULTISPECIES: YdbL family protein [unclassified Scandinavium]MDX6022401.1 YdbL family protein [Scandinavium sp. V105_16]MDX6033757.1 YdbL family protein [Scandinavium sp. V105_12]MDX6042395.1 YdbL family protein [Scandinavium sp. V105_6]MDX6052396.1 YdbL family protein [Scandinavium sp. V105_1]
MKKYVLMAVLSLGLIGQSAQALTLDEARGQGRVGETLTGYLAPITQDKDTLALVKKINNARSESYQQLADSNNLPVDEVAKMAGQKLVARALPGEYVKGLNGKWLKK